MTIMNPDLEMRLKNLTNLPSPPGVATQIIQMAQDPDIRLEDVALMITRDPSLAAKILRVANSPMYAQRRKCNNLRQALIVLGLNAAVTLSLSFSLVSDFKKENANGLDYPHFWRRSLLAAIAARAIAEQCKMQHREELFLAALMQDIGMIALDRAMPELYRDASDIQTDHQALCAFETEQVGNDHSSVGAWLLSEWSIPAFIQVAVGCSHVLEQEAQDACKARKCVALSGLFADMWMNDANEHHVSVVAAAAHESLAMDKEAVGEVMNMISSQIPDLSAMFEMDLVDGGETESILEKARETLMIRNLISLQEATELRKAARTLKTRTQSLEHENRHDKVTGVCNRKRLDELLETGFRNACRFGWPLSIAFVDLDHFKKVNDTHGHVKGDAVLRAAASMLSNNVRASDTVGRYGGEEFIVILPGADCGGAKVVSDRILNGFRTAGDNPAWNSDVVVTASIGTATVNGADAYASVSEFIDAADQALYTAKESGRDRACQAESGNNSTTAVA